MQRPRTLVLAVAVVLSACAPPGAPPAAPPPVVSAAPAREWALPAESHLTNLRPLTFGGENAEAYWSWAGDALIMQARPSGEGCDRIYRLPISASAAPTGTLTGPPVPVSDGLGATTCSYFLPGDREVIYASTEGGGAACPPRPDHSQGYVWALYPTYDIYRANANGSGARRLTTTPGYDAEGTVCAKDGSIVFTSVRDGDIDLYRMDADGGNVRRLTSTPGYDGGAFFSPDGSRLVWRAGRPTGPALDEYRALLGRGLVKPGNLEIMVGGSEGQNARAITRNGKANFAPSFLPDSRRVIFASDADAGPSQGRAPNFDLYVVDPDAPPTMQGLPPLERVTFYEGFDSFPMFSPDGEHLAFASNRNGSKPHETNIFVARWVE
jgi:TolB protein